MLKAFCIFLIDFVLLGTLNCVAIYPQGGVDLALKSALCSLPLALVCASPVLLFGKWSYVGLFPMFAFACLNVSFQWVVHHWFGGMVGEGLLASIFLATWSEVKEFAVSETGMKCVGVVCSCIVFVVGNIVLMIRLRGSWVISLRQRLYVMIGVLLCGMVVPAMTGDDYLIRALTSSPTTGRSGCLDVFADLREAGRYVDPARFRLADRSVTGVVVIGESASRLHWSLYGYGRKTTPLIQARSHELVALSNLQCTASLTPYALRDLFTREDNGHLVSLPSLVCSLGLDVSLVSGQSRFGLYDGADELLFRQCRNRMYLDELVDGRFYDDALVPFVQDEICASNRQVVFVHLMGSHFDYGLRYPEREAVFPVRSGGSRDGCQTGRVRDSVNAYDNSIAFTDRVLDRMISDLADTGKKAFLIYVSDHGESPASHYRDESQASLFALPFVVWLSPLYRESYPERLKFLSAKTNDMMVSSDCMAIFLHLLGIEQIP